MNTTPPTAPRRWTSWAAAFAVMLAATVLTACHTPVHQRAHVIMVSPEGWLDTNSTDHGPHHPHLAACIGPVFDGLARTTNKNILIFIQGGMNSLDQGIRRANELSQEIMLDPNANNAYPIFISWNSRLDSCWKDHMKVVKGKPVAMPWDMFTVGYYVFADVFLAIGQTPWTFLFTEYNQAKGVHELFKPFDFESQKRQAETNAVSREATNGWAGLYRSCHLLETNGARLICPAPTNGPDLGRCADILGFLVPQWLGSLVIDTGGRAGWNQMLRRTETMYVPSDDHLERGGVDTFFQHLESFMQTNQGYSVTLVAHSMGAIIANEILRRHYTGLNISNIVYMGAACSVQDFGEKVVPFLAFHPETHLYLLCLHPTNERAEDHLEIQHGAFEPLTPHGSLLQWINDYYSYQADLTPSGQCLGSFEESMPLLRRWINAGGANLPPEISPHPSTSTHAIATNIYSQITVHCFGIGSVAEAGPQRHGDFSTVRFWDPLMWNSWSNTLANQHLYTSSRGALAN